MQVGLEQRNVPVYVVNEYCRNDRSFEPTPEFKEDKLPQELTFKKYKTNKEEAWFPLVFSDSSGLGINFALLRGKRHQCRDQENAWVPWLCQDLLLDWEAMNRLEIIRTADLIQLRARLKSTESDPDNTVVTVLKL